MWVRVRSRSSRGMRREVKTFDSPLRWKVESTKGQRCHVGLGMTSNIDAIALVKLRSLVVTWKAGASEVAKELRRLIISLAEVSCRANSHTILDVPVRKVKIGMRHQNR
jgi:hypothetical protein